MQYYNICHRIIHKLRNIIAYFFCTITYRNCTMSRRLKMGEESGGFDPSSYMPEEFERKEGFELKEDIDTSRDEEIARRLQMEEFENANPSFVVNNPALQDTYIITQRQNTENRIRQIEQAQERREQELQTERAERQRELQAERAERQREREQLARAERERDEERNKRQALENIANYATIVRHTYPASFDRIYNWGLTLVPNYYDYDTRQWLREQLSKLIKRELLLHSTENEVEDKIRRLINDAEYDILLKKKEPNTPMQPEKKEPTPSRAVKPRKPRSAKRAAKSRSAKRAAKPRSAKRAAKRRSKK